ncbi:translation initiation factor IF-3, mitochondrial [Periophthalmus magnuspinnatus]|uniref:translation initiation factor IF-3, mitochondrial n=1 Tax=Periophthalmus magnuspinnatus TaxID=409849 RepID=UPI00145B7B3F|nr:translation initiation factor IF-3, mitochondrial [Periophthalmus magnuspinnatus]
MSAGCARWLLNFSTRAIRSSSPVYRLSLARSTTCTDKPNVFTIFWSRSMLCTTAENTPETPTPKKKKPSGHSNASISSIGRKIPHRLIQVIGESGGNMGTMHRSDVLRIMDEQGLKLVLLSENQDPPVYRLMSGKQIHEEQLMLREKQKAKPAPVQVKELTFSSGIATHDLTTKLKQVESWLEKKHHVRITLRSSRNSTGNMDSNLESLVQQMEVDFGYVSKPKVIRDGQAAMCILRPPSAKELAQKSKKKQIAESSTESASTSVDGTKNTSESSVQQ